MHFVSEQSHFRYENETISYPRFENKNGLLWGSNKLHNITINIMETKNENDENG